MSLHNIPPDNDEIQSRQMSVHVDVLRAWGIDFIQVCGNTACDSQPTDIIFYTKLGGSKKNRGTRGAAGWDDQKIRQFCCKCQTSSNWMGFAQQQFIKRMFPKSRQHFYWHPFPVPDKFQNLIITTVGIATKK
jgi:hypothetical protein